MKTWAFIVAVTAALAAAPAAAAPSGADASIPFVSHGGIHNFEAPNDNTLYLQSSGNRWYKAEIAGPCYGLTNAFGLRLDTGGTDTFDTFSSVIVDGQRCPVTSVSAVAGPPQPKAKPLSSALGR